MRRKIAFGRLSAALWISVMLLGMLAPVATEAHSPDSLHTAQASGYGCELSETAVDPYQHDEANRVPNVIEGKQYGYSQWRIQKDHVTKREYFLDAAGNVAQDTSFTLQFEPPPALLRPGDTFELHLTAQAELVKTNLTASGMYGWYEADGIQVKLTKNDPSGDVSHPPSVGGLLPDYIRKETGTYTFTFPADSKPKQVKILEGGHARGGFSTYVEYVYECSSTVAASSTPIPPSQVESPSSLLARPPFDMTEPYPNAFRMTIQVAQRQVAPGELVIVPIYLIKGENPEKINFDLSYNPEVVRPEGNISRGNLLDSAVFSADSSTSGLIRITFSQNTGIWDTGTLAYLPFRAIGQVGERSDLILQVTSIDNASEQKPTLDSIVGQITIASPEQIMRGNCTGHPGLLNAYDALCALEMSRGQRPVNMVMDVDNDGNVTENDAKVILQDIQARVGQP